LHRGGQQAEAIQVFFGILDKIEREMQAREIAF